MYTVVRFQESDDREDRLENLGQDLNKLIPSFFNGMDSGVEGRFSCSIHNNDDWFDHRKSILAFVKRCRSILKEARSLGIEVQFDVAVEPEDHKPRNLFSFGLDPEFMSCLADVNASILITVY